MRSLFLILALCTAFLLSGCGADSPNLDAQLPPAEGGDDGVEGSGDDDDDDDDDGN